MKQQYLLLVLHDLFLDLLLLDSALGLGFGPFLLDAWSALVLTLGSRRLASSVPLLRSRVSSFDLGLAPRVVGSVLSSNRSILAPSLLLLVLGRIFLLLISLLLIDVLEDLKAGHRFSRRVSVRLVRSALRGESFQMRSELLLPLLAASAPAGVPLSDDGVVELDQLPPAVRRVTGLLLRLLFVLLDVLSHQLVNPTAFDCQLLVAGRPPLWLYTP